MHAMGDKNSARACARKAGVPVTPGSDGIVETEKDAIKVAKKIGYPRHDQGRLRAAAGAACASRITSQACSTVFTARASEAEKAFGNAAGLHREADR